MAFVDHCQTAEDVRANARRVMERRRAQWRRTRAELHGEAPPVVPAISPRAIKPEIKSLSAPVTARFQLQFQPITPQTPIAQIVRAVCNVFGITVEEFNSSRRQARLVIARQIAFGLCRKLTSRSFPEIGRRCGNKDHSTVLHACRKVQPIINRVAELLPADATIDDWASKAYEVADEFPELYPFANCGIGLQKFNEGRRAHELAVG